MADHKIRLALIQNNKPAPYCLPKLGHPPAPYNLAYIVHPPYLFTYYVICLHHVTSTIFVYISEAKVRLGAILSSISRSSAMFVYVLCHFFTRLKLG